MGIIGRMREIAVLDQCLGSGRPEFVAVYGRRRVGKTFLVREYFKDGFSFYATGIADGTTRNQLRAFSASLAEHGAADTTIPKDWFEAFARLKMLLSSDGIRKDRASGRRVVFLDELPWFDTARSSFKSALDWFWNGWASAQSDLMLVVCGSAASWVIHNLLEDHGGFYNRVTRRIQLRPFTLGECEQLLRSNGVAFTRQQVIESYMVFGGIPHYLNLIDRRSSLAQNVQQLFFDPSAELKCEVDILFRSLFKRSHIHRRIVDVLAERPLGMVRTELSAREGIGDGKELTMALRELEQCGFVRRYRNYSAKKNGHFYQLIDPFTLFCKRFVENPEFDSWLEYLHTPSYRAWTGLAFEMVCLAHVGQIKRALDVAGVRSNESAWRSKSSRPGAQIDLLIDRSDGVINVCEAKFSESPFVIDSAYEERLLNKVETFEHEAQPQKALHLTMVTSRGVARNAHYGIVVNEVTGDDLFAG